MVFTTSLWHRFKSCSAVPGRSSYGIWETNSYGYSTCTSHMWRSCSCSKTAPCICAQRGDGIFMEKAMLCTGSKSPWLQGIPETTKSAFLAPTWDESHNVWFQSSPGCALQARLMECRPLRLTLMPQMLSAISSHSAAFLS